MLYENISISKNYIHIKNQQQNIVTLGGNQGWWKEKNEVLADYGCGVIAMCDLECYLYRRNAKKEMTREAYMEYTDKRFREAYHFSELPVVKCLGLVPKVMCDGINQFCINNNQKSRNAKWAESKNAQCVIQTIYTMLEHKLPVIASYDCTLKGKPLPFYTYDVSNTELKKLGEIKSHYFIILGIWSSQGKKELFNIEDIQSWLNDCQNKKIKDNIEDSRQTHYYLEIATYGIRCYIPLDMWIKQLGMFTNILSMEC